MSLERSDDLVTSHFDAQTNLERLHQMGSVADAARLSVAEMLGAISGYLDVHDPLPYKRPDESVVDILRSANTAITALIVMRSANHEMTETDA